MRLGIIVSSIFYLSTVLGQISDYQVISKSFVDKYCSNSINKDSRNFVLLLLSMTAYYEVGVKDLLNKEGQLEHFKNDVKLIKKTYTSNSFYPELKLQSLQRVIKVSELFTLDEKIEALGYLNTLPEVSIKKNEGIINSIVLAALENKNLYDKVEKRVFEVLIKNLDYYSLIKSLASFQYTNNIYSILEEVVRRQDLNIKQRLFALEKILRIQVYRKIQNMIAINLMVACFDSKVLIDKLPFKDRYYNTLNATELEEIKIQLNSMELDAIKILINYKMPFYDKGFSINLIKFLSLLTFNASNFSLKNYIEALFLNVKIVLDVPENPELNMELARSFSVLIKIQNELSQQDLAMMQDFLLEDIRKGEYSELKPYLYVLLNAFKSYSDEQIRQINSLLGIKETSFNLKSITPCTKSVYNAILYIAFP